MGVRVLSGIKPSLWALHPSRVEPTWRWAWHGLVFALPLWEGVEEPFIPIVREKGVFGATAPIWREGIFGAEMRGAGASHIDYALTDRIKAARPLSIVLGITWTTTSNTVVFEANGNDGWSVQTFGPGPGNPELLCNIGGGASSDNRVELNDGFNDGEPHLIVFSFAIDATDDEAYADGVLETQTRPTSTQQPNYGAETRLDVFSRNGSSGFTEDL